MARVSFSMTSVRPKRCSKAATWVATCRSDPWSVASSWAVPNPALAGGGVLVATAAPTTVAATATMTRARMITC